MRMLWRYRFLFLSFLPLVPTFAEPPAVRKMVEKDDVQLLRAHAISTWRRIANHGPYLSRLPLPRTAVAPKIDGKLDDACWQTATSVFDSAIYSGFSLPDPKMRYRFCANDTHLFVGCDLRVRRSRNGWSSLDVRVKKQKVRIDFNRKKNRFYGPGKKGSRNWVDWCEFAGGKEGGSFEVAIPMAELFETKDWKKDGVHVQFAYGSLAGSDLTEKRWMHLFDSPMALRMDDPKDAKGPNRSFGATILGMPDKGLVLDVEVAFVRDTAIDKAEVISTKKIKFGKGKQNHVVLTYCVPFHDGCGAVSVRLKGQGIDWRHPIFTLGLPVSVALTKAQKLLTTYADSIPTEQVKRWEAEANEIAQETKQLRARLAKDPGDSGVWRKLYFRARRLQRAILLAQLPSDLDEILFAKRYPYTAGGRWFTTHYHFEPGGHNLCVYSIKTGKLRNILNVPDRTAVRDPDLHFDGKKIVFCARGKKPEIFRGFTDDLHDVWSIYEVNADGTGLKRITKSEAYDLEPVYLPNGKILFGSLRSKCWGCCTGHSAYNFHVMDADGSNIRRFTSNYLYDEAASLLPDGRIIFLRWVHEDKPGNHINALWTVRQDGAGLAGFFGMNVYGCFIEPRGIPGTNEVVCIDSGPSGHWRLPQNGRLGIIDPAFSRDVLAQRIDPPLPFGGGWGFKTPYPLTKNLFLVSFGNLWHGFGIYVVDRQGNMELLYKDPKLSCVKAVPFAPRKRPPVTSSISVAKGEEEPATIAILDVYNALPGIKRGVVKSLRVVQVPDKDIVRNGNSQFADQTIAVSYVYRMVRKVLGTVPVREDGSAFFRMPAKKAVYFQLLDRDGLMVQTMRDNTSFEPGEKASCIGCHEPRERAPSSMPEALALRRPPAELAPPEGGPRGVSFPRDIQPILDRNCVRCHDVTKPEGGVILSGDVTTTFNVAYEVLNEHNRDWGHSRHPKTTAAIVPVITYVAEPIPPRSTGAYTSPLFKKYVFGKHYDVKLTKKEIATLAMWVDLNLPYYDDWDSKRYEGGRNIVLSREAMKVLTDVAKRRCAECHAKKKPLAPSIGLMVNLSRPELSKMLRAPLAAEAGGMGKGKMVIFKSKSDPDYQAILKALQKERTRIPSLVTSALDKGQGATIK